MNKLEDQQTRTRANQMAEALQDWLQSKESPLQEAVDRTLAEGLFSRSDLQYQLSAFRETAKEHDLIRWVRKNAIRTPINPKTILAVHAGNLPLVSFQDILAVFLSGHQYVGKLSSSDPYLPLSLLEVLKKHLKNQEVHDPLKLSAPDQITSDQITSNLRTSDHGTSDHRISDQRPSAFFATTHWADLYQLAADAMIFSGSADTVDQIQGMLKEYSIVRKSAPILCRTTHFSIAYFDPGSSIHGTLSHSPYTDLAEAICRHNGNGCRSVGIVVSPFGLEQLSCELTDHLELCLMKCGYGGEARDRAGIERVQTQKQALRYRYAYHKVRNRTQVFCGPVLITEMENPTVQESELPSVAGEVIWVRGDMDTLMALVHTHRADIQSVYINEASTQSLPDGSESEPLNRAQKPPLDWKPDGIDPLHWIAEFAG